MEQLRERPTGVSGDRIAAYDVRVLLMGHLDRKLTTSPLHRVFTDTVAPEVIELKGASPASDIWSLGCTIVEMLTGRPPYADLLAMTTLFRIVEDERPPLPSNLSVDLLDFLCQCFQKDPSLRPSAGTLGRHVWIKRNFASKVRSIFH